MNPHRHECGRCPTVIVRAEYPDAAAYRQSIHAHTVTHTGLHAWCWVCKQDLPPDQAADRVKNGCGPQCQ
jgi:hypothetical protein